MRTLAVVTLSLVCGCASFLSIDDATVTLTNDSDAGVAMHGSLSDRRDDRYEEVPGDAGDVYTVVDASTLAPEYVRTCIDGEKCARIECPAERDCRVRCEGSTACSIIACPVGAKCTIECATPSACPGLHIEAASTSVLCLRVLAREPGETASSAPSWASALVCDLPASLMACVLECPSGYCEKTPSCMRSVSPCVLHACGD